MVPAQRAEVRPPGGSKALCPGSPVAQPGLPLPALPGNARRAEQAPTARSPHWLLPVAARGVPALPVVDVPC
jgi:hypothetical protein